MTTQTITDFFLGLQRRGRDPRLDKLRGTVRYDIQGAGTVDQWLLTIDHGQLRVSRDAQQEPDAVVIAQAESLERIIRGEDHASAAMLRGCVQIRGDWRLALMLERIFPSPSGTRGPRLRRQGVQA